MQIDGGLWLHTILTVYGHKELLLPTYRNQVYELVKGSIERQGCKLHCIGGTANHIHFIVGVSHEISIDELLKKIKLSVQTDIRHRYCATFLWEEGYYAYSVGESDLNDEKKSIANEGRKHRSISLEQELTELREDLSLEETDELTDLSEHKFN